MAAPRVRRQPAEVLNPALAPAPLGRPQRGPELRAIRDHVAYHGTLNAGTFDFAFRSRATSAGRFVQPVSRTEMIGGDARTPLPRNAPCYTESVVAPWRT
jgi:hypothetical protein